LRVSNKSFLTHFTRLTLVLASCTDGLAAEEGSQAHIPTWADQVLAGTAAAALGWVTLLELSDVRLALDGKDAHTPCALGVRETVESPILALLAVKLGTDRAGDVRQVLDILGGDGGAGRVLVKLSLGLVRNALCGLHKVSARLGLEDDAVLKVAEGGGLGATARLALDWTVHLFFLNILIQGGNQTVQWALLGLALAGDGQALVALALLAHWLAAKELRQTHIPARADQVLAGTTRGALGANGALVGGQNTRLVRTGAASHATVGAGLAHHSLADLGGDAGAGVVGHADGTAWALHEVSLGVVNLLAAIGHRHILALGSHVDNALLGV